METLKCRAVTPQKVHSWSSEPTFNIKVLNYIIYQPVSESIGQDVRLISWDRQTEGAKRSTQIETGPSFFGQQRDATDSFVKIANIVYKKPSPYFNHALFSFKLICILQEKCFPIKEMRTLNNFKNVGISCSPKIQPDFNFCNCRQVRQSTQALYIDLTRIGRNVLPN